MIVNTSLPASVTIAAGSNPACSGTTVTFTATPVNGGTTPSYQWKVNGVNAGTNSATYAYIPLNNDIVSCVMTSSTTCATGSPATSNSVTMVVNTSLPASVTIAAGSNPACSGTTVTFTATPVNGGTTPSYQWKVNGVNAGTNSATYAYIPLNNDVVSCVMTSNATCASGSPATSNSVTMIINTSLPVSVAISASQTSVCTGSSVTFTANPTNGGTLPSYQWKVNGGNTGTNSSTFTYIPANNDVVTCVLVSNLGCVTGNPATSNPVTLTVGTSIPVSVTLMASANPVCAGTSVTLTPIPTNGGTRPKYTWYRNSIQVPFTSVLLTSSYTYTPVNGDVIYVTMVSNAACASTTPVTSNFVTMSVNGLVGNAGPISGPATFVPGNSGVGYSVAPIANATSYIWSYSGTGVTINGSGPAVTLNFSSNATGGTLWVRGHNSCGDGVQSVLVITRASSMPTPPPGITQGSGNEGPGGINNSDPVVTIFPNPVQDNLNVLSTADIKKIQVLNQMEQIVLWSEVGSKSSMLNISGLQPGVYYVRVLMNDGYIVTRKIIVRD